MDQTQRRPHKPRVDDGRESDLLRFIFTHPTLPSLRGNPDKILALIDEFSAQKKLIHVGPSKGDLISSVIAQHKPSTIVEFGGYVGYSAIRFGEALRKAGGTQAQYLSFEINPVYAAIATVLVELAGLNDVVKIILASGHISLAKLQLENKIESIDMLFMDHWGHRYLSDLWIVEKLGLLRPGSVFAADNVSPSKSREFVEWLQGSQEKKREVVSGVKVESELTGVELAKVIVESEKEDFTVAGNPDVVYEATVHEFSRGSGFSDGVAIAKLV